MYAILHEGKSIDKGFFELLLEHLELDKNLISFLGMGSKSNFFKIDNKRYKDLILSTLSEEQDDCINSFLEKCPEFRGKDSHKSIFNVIYKNAYPKAPYNFEHENFNELKTKLKNLFKE